MTTAAAVDRLVHHSEILELNAKSYRAQKASKKGKIDGAKNVMKIMMIRRQKWARIGT
jgi:hypothetical protein